MLQQSIKYKTVFCKLTHRFIFSNTTRLPKDINLLDTQARRSRIMFSAYSLYNVTLDKAKTIRDNIVSSNVNVQSVFILRRNISPCCPLLLLSSRQDYSVCLQLSPCLIDTTQIRLLMQQSLRLFIFNKVCSSRIYKSRSDHPELQEYYLQCLKNMYKCELIIGTCSNTIHSVLRGYTNAI